MQKVEGLANPRGLYIVSLFTDPQFSLKTVHRARVIKYKPNGGLLTASVLARSRRSPCFWKEREEK